MSRWSEENSWYQVALPCNDHQECKNFMTVLCVDLPSSSSLSLTLCYRWISCENILHSKWWYLMIKMSEEDSAHRTISPQLVWNRSSVRCLWDSTRAGTRSSSTCPTSPAEHMEPTTSRHSESRSMPIAASAVSTSLTAFTPKRNFRQSSSSSYQSRSKMRMLPSRKLKWVSRWVEHLHQIAVAALYCKPMYDIMNKVNLLR